MKLCFPVMSAESDAVGMAMSGDFETNLRTLHEIGFTGIELMIRDAERVDIAQLREQLNRYNLTLAAVGVTPMVVKDKLTLANPSADIRNEALRRGIAAVQLAGAFGAPFCIGSFRGSIDSSGENNRETAMQAFTVLCRQAAQLGIEVLFEPQGAANGNYLNTIGEGLLWIKAVNEKNLRMILDLFHMDANERSIFEALQKASDKIGLIHTCDSKRLMMGFGDLPVRDFVAAVLATGYDGFFSTEVKQLPDCAGAARVSFAYFDYLQRVVLQ